MEDSTRLVRSVVNSAEDQEAATHKFHACAINAR